MRIDLPTLMVAGSFVAATAGAFLLLAWFQNRRAVPMLWWAGANFAFAAGLPLTMQATAADAPAFALGITFLNVSPALIWASGRTSNGRPVDRFFLLTGAVIWLIAYAIPQVRAIPGALAALNQAMIAVYLLAAASEFYNRRADQVTSRQPLIVLLTLHGFSFAYGAWESVQVSVGSAALSLSIWLGLLHFETLIFVVGTSIFTVAMMREQNELLQNIQASTDDLTGLCNRRAFYRDGEALVDEVAAGGGRLSVILFDLDGFKSINDRFGHRQGDDMLRLFGGTARRIVRETDIVGRVGGEEFALLLRDAGLPEAREIAERIRVAYAEESGHVGMSDHRATLSAGVIESDGRPSLDALMGMADQALYRAKANGRDRVESYCVEIDTGREGRRIAPAA